MRNLLIFIFSIFAVFSLAACPGDQELPDDREDMEPPAQENSQDADEKVDEEEPMQQQPPPSGY